MNKVVDFAEMEKILQRLRDHLDAMQESISEIRSDLRYIENMPNGAKMSYFSSNTSITNLIHDWQKNSIVNQDLASLREIQCMIYDHHAGKGWVD